MRAHEEAWMLVSMMSSLGCGQPPPPIFLENTPATIRSVCPSETALAQSAQEFTVVLAESSATLNETENEGVAFTLIGDIALDSACLGIECTNQLVALRMCAFRGTCTPGGDYIAIQTCGAIPLAESDAGVGITASPLVRVAVRRGIQGSSQVEAVVLDAATPFMFVRTGNTLKGSGAIQLSTTGSVIQWNFSGVLAP